MEEDKVTALKLAIQEGLDSDIAGDFDFDEHLKELKENLLKNG